MRVWKLPDQVVRIVILVIIAVVVLIVVRQRFVPESFGDLGHYRADAVGEVASAELNYAGMQACVECHEDLAEVKAGSYHRGLTCEGCHGPAADHVDDPTEILPDVPTGRDLCVRCHSYLASRPTGFPQIIEAIHNPIEPCASCHDPHDPTPPEVPESCSACHAEIARTKAVSHHWSIECETCHEAAPEHKLNPRSYLPKKPTERAFCGNCHDVSAGVSSSIPRIDIADHGSRYLCWQCHYPHFPEGS
jgi:ribosomal protein S27AE